MKSPSSSNKASENRQSKGFPLCSEKVSSLPSIERRGLWLVWMMYGSFRRSAYGSYDELEANDGNVRPVKTPVASEDVRQSMIRSGRVIVYITLALLGLCAAPLAFSGNRYRSSSVGLSEMATSLKAYSVALDPADEFYYTTKPCSGDLCCADGLTYDNVTMVCQDETNAASLSATALNGTGILGLQHFKVYSQYGKDSAVGLQYPWIDKAYRVAEPYQSSYFELDATTVSVLKEVYPDALVRWTVQNASTSDSGLLKPGDVFETEFLETGKNYTANVAVYADSRGVNLVEEVSDFFHVQYVRREIRKLSADDKAAVLEAMYDMYAITTEEGQAKFGEDWQNMVDLTALHLSIAGDTACDHLHDGFGFMNGHIAITNIMEKKMQMMKPSIALPYWDYTVDGENIYNIFEKDVYNWSMNSTYNVVLNEEYFGMHDELGDGTLINSIFKDVMKVGTIKDGDDGSVSNPYGYLHAPWNFVNTDKVVRSFTDGCYPSHELQYGRKHFPVCSDMVSVFSNRGDFMDLITTIPYIAHGTLHRYMGTTFDCKDIYEELETNYGMTSDVADLLRDKTFVTMKHLWHDGFMTTPEKCDTATQKVVDRVTGEVTEEDCTYACPTLEDDLAGTGNYTLLDWMRSATGNDPDPSDISTYEEENVGGVYESMTDDQQEAYLRLICNATVKYGDHGTASSSGDVSFWTVHPTMERFQQMILIENYHDGVVYDFQELWPTEYVSWESYKYPECYGHHIDDHLLTLPEDKNVSTQPTNGMLQDMINPITAGLNGTVDYIYDNFDYEHCATESDPFYSEDYCTGPSCCGMGTYFSLDSMNCQPLLDADGTRRRRQRRV